MNHYGVFNRALEWKYSRYLGMTAFVVAIFYLWPNASVKGIQAYAALLGLRPIVSRLIEHGRGAERARLATKLSPVAVLLKLAIIPLVDSVAWNVISLVESLLRQDWSNNRRSRVLKVYGVLSIAANALALLGIGFIQLDAWTNHLISVAPPMSGWTASSLRDHTFYFFSIFSNR